METARMNFVEYLGRFAVKFNILAILYAYYERFSLFYFQTKKTTFENVSRLAQKESKHEHQFNTCRAP